MRRFEEKAKPIGAMIVRILTIPPFLALLLLVYLYSTRAEIFGSLGSFWLSLIFLVFCGLLSYPVQFLFGKIPALGRFAGREAQRAFAMVFAVAGYIAGLATAWATGASRELRYLYLGYLLCGAAILIANKLLHFRLSGHAVGVAGPMALLAGLGDPMCLCVLPLIACVVISSLRAQRHTWTELLAGLAVPLLICIALRAVLL